MADYHFDTGYRWWQITLSSTKNTLTIPIKKGVRFFLILSSTLNIKDN